MKKDLHPNYHEVTFECACGSKFVAGSTKKGDLIKLDICNQCHPFYTGKQKHIDSGGRIDKFNKRYAK